jgi:hypothetical protein
MAEAIPTPHVPFTPGSSSLLDVPRPGAPSPFSSSSSLPPPLPSQFLFWCFVVLLFCIFWVFLHTDLLRACFAALHPLLGFFHAPTTTSFHYALLCTRSMYTRSVSFPIFLFAYIQLYCFSFSCISFVICL